MTYQPPKIPMRGMRHVNAPPDKNWGQDSYSSFSNYSAGLAITPSRSNRAAGYKRARRSAREGILWAHMTAADGWSNERLAGCWEELQKTLPKCLSKNKTRELMVSSGKIPQNRK